MSQIKKVNERDYSIDFAKGVTVISIIFIHTVWWSGTSYAPDILRQLSLLIDVPLFFFLSGCSATFAFKKEKPFSGIVRLISLFTLAYFIYALIYKQEQLFEFTFSALFINYLNTYEIAVFSNSTWFILPFVIVYITGFIIIKQIGSKNILLLICLILFYFILKYDQIHALSKYKLLSLSADYLFSYLLFFLLGYYFKSTLTPKLYKTIGAILLLCSLSATLWIYWDIPFNLQNYKFPPKIEYVVASIISISLFLITARLIKKEYKINYIGKNALSFYLAQGIGSSLLFQLSPLLQIEWYYKLPIMFLFNLVSSTIIAIAVIYIFNNYTKIGNTIIKRIDDL
ncbi:MAG: hypothetical protein CMC96_11935 [Flavobacteriales bacterium]|nr:hypothetical protein [Flavobacteriales bacterium]|tara:strand:+ start:8624 stop:9649 length:1026 start_codon:yes stop_codon:yes gene_type:complete